MWKPCPIKKCLTTLLAPTMAKTVTQETRVVFGPEQEEWRGCDIGRIAILRQIGSLREGFPSGRWQSGDLTW